MRLKKTNAVIALITTVLFLVHSLYQTISYAVSYVNIPLKASLGGILALFFIAHVIISLIIIFGKNDTVKITYRDLNKSTLFQRDFGIFAAVLFIPHVATAMHIGDVAGTAWYYVFQVIQVAFFGALFIHISCSFVKAFITLGILQDIKKEKMISNAAALISAILWMIMSIVVVSTYNRVYMGA